MLVTCFIRKCKFISQGVKGKLAVKGANNLAKYGSGFKYNSHVPCIRNKQYGPNSNPCSKSSPAVSKGNDQAALSRKVLSYHVSSLNLAVSRTEKKNYAAFAIKCSVKEVAL